MKIEVKYVLRLHIRPYVVKNIFRWNNLFRIPKNLVFWFFFLVLLYALYKFILLYYLFCLVSLKHKCMIYPYSIYMRGVKEMSWILNTFLPVEPPSGPSRPLKYNNFKFKLQIQQKEDHLLHTNQREHAKNI